MRYLDLESWERREHFAFFRRFDKPFFNLCAEVDVTALREHTTAPGGPSFFLAALWLSLRAANEVPELRYRLRGERVGVHEVIHGGGTVLRDDGSFAFAYFDYHHEFARFHREGEAEVAAAKVRAERLADRPERDDLIYYSVIPWVAFTSFSHARCWGGEDSVPRIVFGKHHEAGGRRRMPVSVEAHHSLVDGLHVGRWFERFQAYLDAPSAILGEPA